MIRLALLLALTAFTVDVSSGVAQDLKGYVAIGGLASITSTGEPPVGSVSFPKIGLGGTAAGFTVEAGRFVSRGLSVGFEASVPLRFDGEQFSGYYLNEVQLESAHRDILFSGLVREGVPVGATASVGLEIGGTVVFEDTVRRTAHQIVVAPSAPVTFGPLGAEFAIRRGTLGLLVGADYEVRVARRVDLITQIRAYWVNRDTTAYQDTEVVGLGSFVLRPAVGVRFIF
jgi:hypothetical protein